MEKFFTSSYSTPMLLVLGLIVGLSVVPEHLQKVAAGVGMIGLGIGMTKQVIMQYHSGKVGIHWTLNATMFFAVVLRAIYMLRTGQYWLAGPDIYGALMAGAIQLQLAGYLLKKQLAPRAT